MAPSMTRDEAESLPVIPYAEVRGQLRSGDLLFASGKYRVSELVQSVTHSIWSHIGIVLHLPILERVLLLESVEGVGVRIVPVSKYLNDYLDEEPFQGLVAIARVEGITPEIAKTLMQFGADELGRPYNDAEIAALKDPAAFLEGKVTFRPRTYVCSELVRACFHEAGLDFSAGQGGLISPEDIWADPHVTFMARIL